jgi:hypothetical protein
VVDRECGMLHLVLKKTVAEHLQAQSFFSTMPG